MADINHGERLAVLEAMSFRLYGQNGDNGDIGEIKETLKSVIRFQYMLMGMGTIVSIAVPVIIAIIEHSIHGH